MMGLGFLLRKYIYCIYGFVLFFPLPARMIHPHFQYQCHVVIHDVHEKIERKGHSSLVCQIDVSIVLGNSSWQ